MEKEKLAAILEEPVWQEHQKEELLEKWESSLWGLVQKLAIGLFTISLIAALFASGLEGLALAFIAWMFMGTGVYIFCVILSFILALFPHKRFGYNDRLSLWIPFNLLVMIGLGLIAGVLLFKELAKVDIF